MIKIQIITYYLLIAGTVMVIIGGWFFMLKAKTRIDIFIFGSIIVVIEGLLGFLMLEQNNPFITGFIVVKITAFILGLAMIFLVIFRRSPVMDKLKIIAEKLSVRK